MQSNLGVTWTFSVILNYVYVYCLINIDTSSVCMRLNMKKEKNIEVGGETCQNKSKTIVMSLVNLVANENFVSQ